MIRSRSIPAVLSRATGDGIHAILLIDADGELLGSYGSPPPVHQSQDDDGGTASAHSEKNHWPLDAASIGALISEVAGDYRRMGEELLLLDPQYDSQRQSNVSGVDGQKDGGGQVEGGLQQQQNQDGSSNGIEREGNGGSPSLQQAGVGEKNGKDNSGTNLKSLVIELDYGIVGVASAGPDFYVIALADATVQHGALAGRLRSLGSHVGEALSQLD
ncbi:hypothetical protein ACHAXR_011969 [Thalassiosira sp. AJA248-18]